MKVFSQMLLAALLLAAASYSPAFAQRQRRSESAEAMPARQRRLSVEQETELKADQMDKELQLTDRQYRKVLKYYKKDIKYRQDLLDESLKGKSQNQEMSDMFLLVPKKYLDKKDKKLRKILSSEQYSKWKTGHPSDGVHF